MKKNKKVKKELLNNKYNWRSNCDFTFNDNPEKKKNIALRIQKLKKYLKKFRESTKIAHLVSTPSLISINAWRDLIRYNPVLLGNTTDSKYSGTNNESIEQELVLKMIDLYNAKDQNLTGYSTTGSTEGNIFSAWLGRDWLKNKKIDLDKICLLSNNLTHYSVRKSAKIINVNNELIPVNKDKWNIDCSELLKKIEKLVRKNIKGFMLPLTCGYTLTGTDDNIDNVIAVVKKLKNKYEDIEFFCWIDAAMAGLIKPFIDKDFSPFRYPEIKTITVDFHKFGHTPCPSGLILHKKELLNLITGPIDFLDRDDNTLLSTRTAIPPIISLLTIDSLGKKGFEEKIKRNLKFKEKFLNKYKNRIGIKLITTKNNLTIGILAEKQKKKNIEYFKDKYNMYFKKIKIKFPNETKEITASKVYFINF